MQKKTKKILTDKDLLDKTLVKEEANHIEKLVVDLKIQDILVQNVDHMVTMFLIIMHHLQGMEL